MTFREKLDSWIEGYRDKMVGPSVGDILAEASRLHEEEMAEKDRLILATQRVAEDHSEIRAEIEMENAQLREQLGKLQASIKDGVVPTKIYCAVLVELGQAHKRIQDLTESPSSQREEAKDAPDWKAATSIRYNGSGTPCDSDVGPCSCGAFHQAGEFAVKPEPERCQVQINMGTNGYVTEWVTCGKVLPCDHATVVSPTLQLDYLNETWWVNKRTRRRALVTGGGAVAGIVWYRNQRPPTFHPPAFGPDARLTFEAFVKAFDPAPDSDVSCPPDHPKGE